MGKALALIFTGCGIMLLLNFCIFFIVDNIRNYRNRNRSSIIKRSRQNRRRSVSFADPLVKQTMPKRGPSQPEEIEMVDLSSPVQDPPPPPPPPPKPLTRQKQPRIAPGPLAPPSLTRSMSVRQPHRDKVYKTFTIIIILS